MVVIELLTFFFLKIEWINKRDSNLARYTSHLPCTEKNPHPPLLFWLIIIFFFADRGNIIF